MRIHVSFHAEAPDSLTDEQIREWVEFQLGLLRSMSGVVADMLGDLTAAARPTITTTRQAVRLADEETTPCAPV